MKTTLHMKFLVTCIVLVLVTAASLSVAYYEITRRDKQRETRQRMLIAVDILLHEMQAERTAFVERLAQFLQPNTPFTGQVFMLQKQLQRQNVEMIGTYMEKVADQLRSFGRLTSANRLLLYDAEGELLAVYQQFDGEENSGISLPAQSGGRKYLSLENPLQTTAMLMGTAPLPDTPLPAGVSAQYAGPLPAEVTTSFTFNAVTPGVQVLAPMSTDDAELGFLVAEIFYGPETVAQAASLSKSDVDIFVKNQWSLGTLPGYTLVDREDLTLCSSVMEGEADLHMRELSIRGVEYDQGTCRFTDPAGDAIGLVSVSLSQEIAQQELTRILTIVLLIAAGVCLAASGASLLVSRPTMRSVQEIVRVISATTDGDLRAIATTMTNDEIGMVSKRLNQMISQLRQISAQVQGASQAVNSTADTIVGQMEGLIRYMENQAASVDNTTASIETIDRFIDTVAQNTDELLAAADQIVSSIQETRYSLEEVTGSTQSLTENLQRISASVDQVNQATKHIDHNAGDLEQAAHQTEAEISRIDQSYQNVSENANLSQALAQETQEAAISAQTSVNASLQGMTELKDVVANTAEIIQEVNAWGEEVSSILDIVDEITGQTALLSLNASIISAQAGVHGRGFAVVAGEIKELADRTKNSTKEIGNLVHALQAKTEEGVKNIQDGLQKADQGLKLTTAVREALDTILDSATRSSTRAADTATVIQQTTESSRIIGTSMTNVTELVSQIRSAIQDQARDMEAVVEAVDNISGMAEQVNHANQEHKKAAGEVERSMMHVTERFNRISTQTEELKDNSRQIVEAMHIIESTTNQILENAGTISGDTVKNLLHQSELLQDIISVFKVK